MANEGLPRQANAEPSPAQRPPRAVARVARYVVVRAAMLFLLLTLGLYLAIIVANLGGYIDEIYRDRVENALGYVAMGMEGMSTEERVAALDQIRAQMEEAYGLNQPFLLRCVRWLYAGMTLDMVTPEVLEAFPRTLLLVATSYLLLFFSATFLSLFLSRRYGTFVDRLVTALSPLSAAPSWVHGIVLVAIFAVELRVLPFSGMYDLYPPDTQFGYVFVVLKHMVLPVAAILLSVFFQCVYAWRTFFLIHSSEDYVELAKAKGLSDRTLERRYVLRPALPYFITSFALLLVSFWQETIALEYFFSWPGIGKLYIESVRISWYSPTNIIAIMVIFAYLLAISVFVLDIVYVLIDPRVRVGGGQVAGRPAAGKEKKRGLRPARPAPVPRRDLASLATGATRVAFQRPRPQFGRGLRRLGGTLLETARFPSAVVGLVLILALVGVSVYAVIAIPYDRAVKLWETGSWRLNPRNARPVWTNLFRRDPLPATVILSSQGNPASTETRAITAEMTAITTSLAFDYPYHTFPQDISIDLTARYKEKKPLSYLTWMTPDGREISLGSIQLASAQTYVVSQDERLGRKLKTDHPVQGLFAAPDVEPPVAVPGRYQLRVKTFVFEEGSDVDTQAIIYGQVYGLAGTDDGRRDLMVALLWGTPVALALGLLGAVGSTLVAITVAAVGAWFGGWVDRLIQWISEANMLLPVFPLAIMIYFRYTKNIWAILAVLIVLSSFGRALKNFRAALLQVREQPYIEAAQGYGAGNGRIILRYMVPRVIPVMVPQLVMMIPGFVFLEATLAILGVSDLYLPTWGKVIYDALTSGILQDHYYWALEPIALLLLTGVAFAMLGYSLDRVFNPRLRSMQFGRE